MTKKRNLFGITRSKSRREVPRPRWTMPGLIETKRQKKYARGLRKARKHKYDFADDFGKSVARSRGMSAVRSDVTLALRGQGFPRGHAKKLAQAASGSDFDSIFRSALSKAKGRNPMSKKKKARKKKKRNGIMPPALAKYWAKLRGKKARKKKNRRKKKNPRRVKTKIRTVVRTKTVYRNRRPRKKKRNRRRSKPRPQLRQINIPGRITPRQAKAIMRAVRRAHPGRKVALKQR